ncbi:MAG: DUF1549 and DUF1553 domain-containing protein [Planctomycetota bacterium]|nr:DUF1549 and DUF1553 domain-containing protein [Planctomycetota bacterium]
MSLPRPLLLALLIFLTGSNGAAAAPGGEGSMTLYPPKIRLDWSQDRQPIVVQWTATDGTTRDITNKVTATWAPIGVAELKTGQILARKPGQTRLTLRWKSFSLTAPVTVRGTEHERPVRFGRDILPIFTRAGCNTGACHGTTRGQDGFHLSLFGYDPAGDYQRLTRQQPGRRIDLAVPEKSLLFEKAVGRASHTGGQRFEPTSQLARVLLQWLRDGAPGDNSKSPQAQRIEVFPPHMVLEGEGSTHRVIVRVHDSDGTDRDVTELASFHSNQEDVARMMKPGWVRSGQRGEAFLLVRFGTFTTGIPITVLPPGPPPPFPSIDAKGEIDRFVFQRLRTLRLTPSKPCSDSVFLRRAHLDLIGLLPTPERTRAFLADPRPDRRARLIDELLQRSEFVDLWVLKWAERLQIRSSNKVSYKATLLYHEWLRERIANNIPLNQIVRELLTAQGGTFSNPATNFFQADTDTLKIAENTAQLFLGQRIQCARCHNHPFDRWTQNDYYGFAAFFSRINRKKGQDPRETVLLSGSRREVKHPVTGKPMAPKFLGGAHPNLKGKDRRQVLAQWLTSPDNLDFARHQANFIWAHFFGRGLVDPVDDVRISNPPSHPELLDALARKLSETRYDLRGFIRDLCNSKAYQLSTQTNSCNAHDQRNLSHALIRRIGAEVLLDCLSQVTGAPNKFQGLPRGARAVRIADGKVSSHFLKTFGRSSRETVCTCEVRTDPNLSQALHLINGKTVSDKIRIGRRIEQLLEAKTSPQKIVIDLYLRCLCREPTAKEMTAIQTELQRSKNPLPVLQDLFWALLNSREFLFNH